MMKSQHFVLYLLGGALLETHLSAESTEEDRVASYLTTQFSHMVSREPAEQLKECENCSNPGGPSEGAASCRKPCLPVLMARPYPRATELPRVS